MATLPFQEYYDRVSYLPPQGLLSTGYDKRMRLFFGPVHPHLARAERVLDVGYGDAKLLYHLSLRHGYRAYGVDLTARSFLRRASWQHAVHALLEISSLRTPPVFASADAETLPFRDGTFDFAYSARVFQYVRDKMAMIREMHRVLRGGGKGVIDDVLPDKLLAPSLDTLLASCSPERQVWTDSYEQAEVGVTDFDGDEICVTRRSFRRIWIEKKENFLDAPKPIRVEWDSNQKTVKSFY